MPIYEYECTQCGQIEEALQKFSDEPLTTCKKCSGKLHKLISQSSFHLKGSGWYVTDYASGSRSSASNNSSKESTDTSKDSGTSDSASKES
uniref:Zinc ribbon domain-containing protein n=1 Tax=Desulfatirhabdium butyrativorans TaxID=340467 RepID=A0A7C4MLU8_9BACT